MTPKVAATEFDGDLTESLRHALELIGGINGLNTTERPVVVKVGVFSHRAENHASVDLVDAITKHFDKAPKIFLAESDNYQGTGSERLQIWKTLFTERVVPVNLSDGSNQRRVTLAGQEMTLADILFKPNVLVSTHILRSFERGSILKNLFGCIPTSKKMKYHKVLPAMLADVYEAVGGVDLAILDGTWFWRGAGDGRALTNTLLAGRDAVAVEAVGAALAGLDPEKMPVIQEFVKRGLGEASLENIEVVGASFDQLKEKFVTAAAAQEKVHAKRVGPQTWGGHAYRVMESLVDEGFFDLPSKRTAAEVIKALEARGLSTTGKEDKVENALARRLRSGVLRKEKTDAGWVYWAD